MAHRAALSRSGGSHETDESLDERGASLTEYALLLALIAIVALTGLNAFSGTLGDNFNDNSERLVTAIDGP